MRQSSSRMTFSTGSTTTAGKVVCVCCTQLPPDSLDRHDRVLFVQNTQGTYDTQTESSYARAFLIADMMRIPVQHRGNLSFLFVFRQNSPKQLVKMYNEFFSVFTQQAEFLKAYTKATENFSCLVLDYVSRCFRPSSSALISCVFCSCTRARKSKTACSGTVLRKISQSFSAVRLGCGNRRTSCTTRIGKQTCSANRWRAPRDRARGRPPAAVEKRRRPRAQPRASAKPRPSRGKSNWWTEIKRRAASSRKPHAGYFSFPATATA